MAVDWGLDGHVTVVTGASRGLGEAAVRAMVVEGCPGRGRRPARATPWLRWPKNWATQWPPCRATCVIGARWPTWWTKPSARFGRLDSVVNNAGIAPASKFVSQPDEVFDEVLAVNLAAPAALARRAARHWIDAGQPGSVINVASTSGLKGKPTLAAYSASKGGLLRLTEALAGEWASFNIRVNVIAPGAFETDAQAAVLGDPDTLAARLRKIPVRRMGQPE